jgi:hypothetical protein
LTQPIREDRAFDLANAGNSKAAKSAMSAMVIRSSVTEKALFIGNLTIAQYSENSDSSLSWLLTRGELGGEFKPSDQILTFQIGEFRKHVLKGVSRGRIFKDGLDRMPQIANHRFAMADIRINRHAG